MANRDHFLNVVEVSKTFEPDTAAQEPIQVIDNVSMNLEAGEFAVYLGPSGCGKTTLMRIVGGPETASSGEVILANERVTGPDRRGNPGGRDHHRQARSHHQGDAPVLRPAQPGTRPDARGNDGGEPGS